MRKTAFLFAVLLPLLVSCSSENKANPRGKKVVFAAGGAPSEVKLWENLLVEFEMLNPGIEAKIHRLPAASDLQLQAHMTALGSGRATYDLLRVDIVWLATFGSRGWLERLDFDFADKDLAVFGSLIDGADRIDGNLLALPWNVDMGLLYYRKDLLEQAGFKGPPKTWEELERMAAAVLENVEDENKGLEGFVWQGKAYEGLTCNFVEHYAAEGGELALVEKNGRWDREPAELALNRMRGLVEKGLSPVNTGTEMTEEPSRLLFQQGRAVFMRNWPYAWALAQGENSPVKSKVGIAPLPAGSSGSGFATLGGWHLGVRAGSKNRAEAVKLLQFLVSAPVQARLARELSWNPSRRELYNELVGGTGAGHLGAVRKALGSVVSRPKVNRWVAFSQKTYDIVNAVILGRMFPAEGADKLSRF